MHSENFTKIIGDVSTRTRGAEKEKPDVESLYWCDEIKEREIKYPFRFKIRLRYISREKFGADSVPIDSEGLMDVKIGDLIIYYNRHLRGSFFGELLGQDLVPDFVVSCDGRVMVCDAKYKYRITDDDLHRLLTYIAEFATPIGPMRQGSVRSLFGCIFKLRDSREGDKQKKEATRIIDSQLGITIKIIELDPSMSNSDIKRSIEEVLDLMRQSCEH